MTWLLLAVAAGALTLSAYYAHLCTKWAELFWDMNAMLDEAWTRNDILIDEVNELRGRR